MPEVCIPPRLAVDENGDELVTFGPEHSWADVVRWIAAKPEDAETVLQLLIEARDGAQEGEG